MIVFLFVLQAYAATLTQGLPTAINSLDPFSIAGIDAFVATGNVLEPLARSNPRTGEIIPVLAKSWTLHEKTRTFDVLLKEGVKFHDGGELTAADVKFTFEAYFQPAYKGELWKGMWSEVEGVRVKSAYVVEFKLKQWRYQTFEAVMTSLRILPRSFYGKPDREKFRTGIVGTGPFKFKSFARHLVLAPHARWHGGPPPPFDLVLKTVPDAKLAGEMMKKGELDFYAGVAEGAKAFSSGLGTGFWLDFNMTKGLFQKAEIREVLPLVWKRSALNDRVFSQKMKLALDVFSPKTDVYPEGTPEKDDLRKAREILKRTGWSDENQDGVLENAGDKLEFTILVNSPAQERWTTLLQNDAKEAGMKVHIYRVEDDGQWLKRLREGRFDLAARDGGLINEVTTLAWATGGPYNYQKFSDAEIDTLTRQLEGEFSLKKRRLILRKAIARIRELRPQVPGLFSEDEHFLISGRLEVDPEFPARAWSWKLR